MKIKAYAFFMAALFIMATVPAINVAFGSVKSQGEKKWWSKSALYNFDFALPYLSRALYPFGISISPNQAVIGKADWLYLGDQYGNSMSSGRLGATAEDANAAKLVASATKKWSEWLSQKGGAPYRIVIGPEKDSIYPEFLPDWARGANVSSPTDILVRTIGGESIVDSRGALKTAKGLFAAPLYYKTDTHWNSLGAWIAFQALSMELSRVAPDFKTLGGSQVKVLKVSQRGGGDLANFLRIMGDLKDAEVEIQIETQIPVDVVQIDYGTGRLIQEGGNPRIGLGKVPLLVRSKHALNRKRALWIHDSFGNAMSPYVAATFTEALHVNLYEATPALIAQLVETFAPDYVFVTAVERALLSSWFQNPPPIQEPSLLSLDVPH